jgi:hypothetical protein
MITFSTLYGILEDLHIQTEICYMEEEQQYLYSIYLHVETFGRCRWVGNIRMDLREIGWDGMDWINLAQDRDWWRALVNTVMNLQVP